MTVEKQVLSIFLGTNGYLDAIELEDVQRFEKEFHETVELRYPAILTTIEHEKDLSKETVEKIHSIAKEFSAKFHATTK